MASSERLLLPSLPFELIEEILYRTPAESLIRFKSTCKKWYTLITNKKFIYTHLDHSPERFIRIDGNDTVKIMDPVTGNRSDSPIPEEFCRPHSISYMVHCDGLMLYMCGNWSHNLTRDAELAVWNPALRKIKWIEPSVRYWRFDYFGIGYDNTSRYDYKILRFSSCQFIRDQRFEIYEFKSDSWRTIDAKFDWKIDSALDWELVPDCKGVSVMGNMYWIATKSFILSFDFSVETFKNICVCPSSYWVRRLGCFNGDRLSLLLQDKDSREIEAWVTNKLTDGVVSFTKYLNVTSPNLPALLFNFGMARPGYSIGKHRNIMAWCEGKEEEEEDEVYIYTTLYDIDEGGIRKEIKTGRHNEFGYLDTVICSYVYVPSLIPVPE